MFPCLILDKIPGNPALSGWSNLALARWSGFFGTVALGMALGVGIERLNGLKDSKEARTFAATIGVYNYSYVPVPLAMLLFGDKTSVAFHPQCRADSGHVDAGSDGCLPALAWGRDWRKILNAPLVAIILALVLERSRFDAFVPKSVVTGIHGSVCALPVALLLIGAVVADQLGAESASQARVHVVGGKRGWRVIGTLSCCASVFCQSCSCCWQSICPPRWNSNSHRPGSSDASGGVSYPSITTFTAGPANGTAGRHRNIRRGSCGQYPCGYASD